MPNTTPEYTYSENPTIQQLISMGWQFLEGKPFDPTPQHRENWHQVILPHILRERLRHINRDDNGNPWLDEQRLTQAINEIEKIELGQLIEINEAKTRLLLNGTTVQGLDDKGKTIQYIDFDHPEENHFLIINQFRVDPPGITGPKRSMIPDLVLFVNGIPLVVIECKSPFIDNPIQDAIGDLFKYSNQGDKAQPRNIERLFYYNLLLIGVSAAQAVVSVVGNVEYKEFKNWKDTTPFDPQELADSLNTQTLNDRHQLIAGMLNPANLLDILQHFTLFTSERGRRTKIIPLYQQYRAVYNTIQKLKHRDTDQNGGLMWHYQGTGKSTIMVFIVRKLRTHPDLQRYKVVFVTDQIDLESQLSDIAHLISHPKKMANNVRDLARYLRQTGPDIVFGMIQKFRDILQDEQDANIEGIEELNQPLNDSPEILVMIDEAHRSHTNTLHATLLTALPNCFRLGFTGTPILSEKKKKTTEIFGPYIDPPYTIRQAQEDGVIVPLYYEGLEARGAVKDKDKLDQLFDIVFQKHNEQQKAAIKDKYVTPSRIRNSKELMKLKARNMLEHYISNILPNNFKGLVAASDREAAVNYQQYLTEAREDIIREIEGNAPLLNGLLDADLETLTPELRFQLSAYRQLDKLRRLEFAAVISSDGKKDPDSWRKWTDPNNQVTHRDRFKQPLEQDGLALLVVKSMLLTGFNAPLTQVLYLDNNLIEHNLLQAIARTNRTASNKTYGLIVDYFGVDLATALQVYDTEDTAGLYRNLLDEGLPELQQAEQNLLYFFAENQWDLNQPPENFIDLMTDAKLRATYDQNLKIFLKTLDNFLPRPWALPYARQSKRFVNIKKILDDAYTPTDKLYLADAKPKVRALIDSHLQAQNITLKVNPIDILSIEFEERIRRTSLPRTQAAQMEHAIRHHINIYRENDPIYYNNLSEELDKILTKLEDNWEAQAELLLKLAQKTRSEQSQNNADPVNRTLRPFYNALSQALKQPTSETEAQLLTLTENLVNYIHKDTQMIDFWCNLVAREEFRKKIWLKLEESRLISDDQLDTLADQIVQLAQRHRP